MAYEIEHEGTVGGMPVPGPLAGQVNFLNAARVSDQVFCGVFPVIFEWWVKQVDPTGKGGAPAGDVAELCMAEAWAVVDMVMASRYRRIVEAQEAAKAARIGSDG